MVVNTFISFDKGAHLSSTERLEELPPLPSGCRKGGSQALTRRNNDPFKAPCNLLELTNALLILFTRTESVPEDDATILEVMQQHLVRDDKVITFPVGDGTPVGA